MSAQNPTVVLMHGAMHTPWIFEPPIERLAARDIVARAVQLPSSNPDSAAARGLIDDVAVVRAAITSVGGPVVLAAHSYGGVPATWAAEEPAVAELVHLAAFVLPSGTSMLDWMGGGFPPDWTHSPDGRAVKAGDPDPKTRVICQGARFVGLGMGGTNLGSQLKALLHKP